MSHKTCAFRSYVLSGWCLWRNVMQARLPQPLWTSRRSLARALEFRCDIFQSDFLRAAAESSSRSMQILLQVAERPARRHGTEEATHHRLAAKAPARTYGGRRPSIGVVPGGATLTSHWRVMSCARGCSVSAAHAGSPSSSPPRPKALPPATGKLPLGPPFGHTCNSTGWLAIDSERQVARPPLGASAGASVARCRDRPGEFFQGNKARHFEVHLAGIWCNKTPPRGAAALCPCGVSTRALAFSEHALSSIALRQDSEQRVQEAVVPRQGLEMSVATMLLVLKLPGLVPPFTLPRRHERLFNWG